MISLLLNRLDEFLEIKYKNFTLKILGHCYNRIIFIRSFILLDNSSGFFAYLILSDIMMLNIDSNISININRLEIKNNFLFFKEIIITGIDQCTPFMKKFETFQISENYNGYLII